MHRWPLNKEADTNKDRVFAVTIIALFYSCGLGLETESDNTRYSMYAVVLIFGSFPLPDSLVLGAKDAD